ncbi:hypothetical protein ACQR07_27955 [Bradyrhizobium sp. HKCCYLS20291]
MRRQAEKDAGQQQRAMRAQQPARQPPATVALGKNGDSLADELTAHVDSTEALELYATGSGFVQIRPDGQISRRARRIMFYRKRPVGRVGADIDPPRQEAFFVKTFKSITRVQSLPSKFSTFVFTENLIS